jgi:hypothetical protein
MGKSERQEGEADVVPGWKEMVEGSSLDHTEKAGLLAIRNRRLIAMVMRCGSSAVFLSRLPSIDTELPPRVDFDELQFPYNFIVKMLDELRLRRMSDRRRTAMVTMSGDRGDVSGGGAE